jgi:hypothetical protein
LAKKRTVEFERGEEIECPVSLAKEPRVEFQRAEERD